MPDAVSVDEDIDFELVTNFKQLAAPPPLRKEAVTVAEWKTKSGKSARFLLWELTASDYADFLESGWTYNKDGSRKRYDNKSEDFRFLGYVIRDAHGNRIFTTTDSANSQLGGLGKATLNLLMGTANKVNMAREADSEGNSDETESV
jgi:hypothetical protein